MSELQELITGVYVKKGIYYSKDHIWIESIDPNNGLFKLGITHPKIIKRGPILSFNINKNKGEKINTGDIIAELETTKSIIYINSPISGILYDINSEVIEVNELMRSNSYDKGWIVQIQSDNFDIRDEEMKLLLNTEKYIACVKEELGPRLGMT